MTKWTIKLDEFDIQYHPCPSMKAQILANFVIEYTIPDNKFEDEANDTIKLTMTPKPDLTLAWYYILMEYLTHKAVELVSSS